MKDSAAVSKFISGRIAYRAGDNSLVGQEQFEIALHKHGATLRAFCEMNDIDLLRDVSIALDKRWQPLDAFCRITQSGQVVASSWFRFAADEIHIESQLGSKGRLAQRFSNNPAYTYVGLHPLQGDALVTSQVLAQGDKPAIGEYIPVHGLTNSISENGDQDLQAVPVTIDVAYLGDEVIRVAAGRFNARKLALRWSSEWPPAYIWVRDRDFIFLKMTWSHITHWYELIEINER